MNQLYRDLILAQARAALAAADSVSNVPHGGLKGQLREIVVRELLRPLLPPDYVLATGQIVSAYGEISEQIDIAACDRNLIPPILFESACGILPIEATLFTIEVKSGLNATELKKSEDAARKLRKFAYAPPVGSSGWDPNHHIETAIPYLLAFRTDLCLTGKTEIERFTDLVGDDEPAIKGLCVAGRGFWCRADGQWHKEHTTEPGEELALMVASILNTCQRVASTRRRPDFRQYLQ